MNYILQISTGTLNDNYYSVNEIIEKIEYISTKVNITKVIFGWYSDINYNKQICEYLKKKNIQSIFKLPIFSEITDKDKEQEFVYFNKYNSNGNTNFYKNDKFDFVCPSSKINYDYILGIFKEIDSKVNFDGVFFDRIRYPSYTLNNNAILGCDCDNCRKLYKDINIDNINSFKIKKRNGFIYEYSDNELNKLMKIKREVITKSVKYLKNNLNGKIIGIDTFAPSLCDLVGQDLSELSKYVDFIKPMNYYHTFAPAGIPYEINGLSEELKQGLSECWKEDLYSISNSVEMSKELIKLDTDICIGIDANNIDGICDSDIEYITGHIKKIENVGIKEVVLSWNTMLIDNKLFDILCKEK